VGITITVAICTADFCLCVDNGDILLDVVQVANVTATIVSYRFIQQTDTRTIIKEQQRLINCCGFLVCLGFRACLRLMLDLCLLTRHSDNEYSHQNKHRETVFHIFYYSSNLIGEIGTIVFVMVNT